MNFARNLMVLMCTIVVVSAAADNEASFPVLPEFTHTSGDAWINSVPLSRDDLKGKVMLVNVWTFECWNCYRSFPWLTSLEAGLQDEPFTVIGIHSPEFPRERERKAVMAKAAEFKLHHPIMMDNDFSYWKALGNRYWPAFYLIDKAGRARGYWVGETHAGDRQATQIKAAIRRLLEE